MITLKARLSDQTFSQLFRTNVNQFEERHRRSVSAYRSAVKHWEQKRFEFVEMAKSEMAALQAKHSAGN
jgi:phosphopentomutase